MAQWLTHSPSTSLLLLHQQMQEAFNKVAQDDIHNQICLYTCVNAQGIYTIY